MRVYVTGADGLLGRALTAELSAAPEPRGRLVHGVSLADFDIADGDAVHHSIGAFAPDVVVHTAALAIVDDCELDPRAALAVNVQGTHHVAAACRRVGARMIYLSSDYVFDGRTPVPGGYREDDVPNPLSVYGVTKLAGERVAATVPEHLVVRTSWLYGGHDPRTDQVLALIDAAAAGRAPALVCDQFSGPTSAADLAAALTWLIGSRRPVRGTLHVANAGRASWHQVGAAVAALLRGGGLDPGPEAVPTAMDDCGFLGARPRDSYLDCDRLAGLGYVMPHWTDALTASFDGLLSAAGRS